MKIKMLEFFTGIGSVHMALRNIGVEVESVGISEVDRYALITYDAIHNEQVEVEQKTKEEMLDILERDNVGYNFSTGKSEIPRSERQLRQLYEAHIRSNNYGDITKINVEELPEFDLFVYSPPCKDISIAGKQRSLEEGTGTQSSLLWECRKVIKSKKPKYLMFENVANLVSDRHKPYFDMWCEELEEMGYVNKWAVLNGLNYGVPQKRERVIMISIREDVYDGFELPLGTDDTKRFIDILEPQVDEKYFVSNPDYQDYIREVVLNSDHKPKNKQVRLGGLFDKNGKRRQAGAIWDKYGIAPTLDTCQGGYRQPLVIDGSRIRKITPKEAWRLQGFSDEDYEVAVNVGLSNSKLYERAGRGIVVPMLEDIFKKLLK